MNALELLTRQHQEIEGLLLRCDTAEGTKRREDFLRLARALLLHAQLEEEQFYVAMRRAETMGFLLDSENEHAEAKALVSQLAKTSVRSTQFGALLAELRACIDAHIAEEQNVFFPLAHKTLGVEGLTALGEAMEERARELEQPGELPTYVSSSPELFM